MPVRVADRHEETSDALMAFERRLVSHVRRCVEGQLRIRTGKVFSCFKDSYQVQSGAPVGIRCIHDSTRSQENPNASLVAALGRAVDGDHPLDGDGVGERRGVDVGAGVDELRQHLVVPAF